MFKIRNNPNISSGVGTFCEGPWSSDRCFPIQQWGLDRHHTTARKKLSKEVNIVVMECCYRSNLIDENGAPLKGYRQRMYRKWLERGSFCYATDQRICGHTRVIRTNGCLTELELDMTKRRINKTGTQEIVQEENQYVEDSFPDSDELVARVELSISINEASEGETIFVNELKEIYDSSERFGSIIQY